MSRVYVVRWQKSRMGNEQSRGIGRTFWTSLWGCSHELSTTSELSPKPNQFSELCSVDQTNQSFQAYPEVSEEMNSLSKGVSSGLLERNNRIMTPITSNPTPKLRKAPQPPLSHRGATPDSDRAKRPPLAQPPPPDQELSPGDRVEGLGDFGKPTGELGTVEQANDDDAVVKWDDDGRTRLHQPWLKKV
jgi:hypothetical protein